MKIPHAIHIYGVRQLSSHRQSADFRESIVSILRREIGNKCIFTFHAEEAKAYLQGEFEWSPDNIVDASVVAEIKWYLQSLQCRHFSEMSRALTGGEYC